MACEKSITQLATEILRSATVNERTDIERRNAPRYPNGSPTPDAVFGSPHIRRGEDPMTSRPFMLLRLFGAQLGYLKADQAKVEIEAVTWFQDTLRQHKWSPTQGGNTATVPLGFSYLPDELIRDAKGAELRRSMANGVEGADPEEAAWLRRRFINRAAMSPAQSAFDETLGGSIRPLPAMGEIISLLRNKEALSNAGATYYPLPPQGSIKFPRVTTPTTANAQAENTTATASTVGTGSLTLSAKKIVSLTYVPNELFRFASPAAEAVLRDDIAKTLALNVDLDCLEGPGDSNRIRGLINYSSIAKPTPGKQSANGDTLQPQDGYKIAMTIEENNAEMTGWIGRPLLWSKLLGFRADAVTAGDQAGTFVQSLMRAIGEMPGKSWCGFPFTTTPQVSRSRQKGTGTTLSYLLGGMWPDFIIGMFGAIEFLASNTSDDAMKNDLTLIRGILLADAGPRHEGAFAFVDNLIYT